MTREELQQMLYASNTDTRMKAVQIIREVRDVELINMMTEILGSETSVQVICRALDVLGENYDLNKRYEEIIRSFTQSSIGKVSAVAGRLVEKIVAEDGTPPERMPGKPLESYTFDMEKTSQTSEVYNKETMQQMLKKAEEIAAQQSGSSSADKPAAGGTRTSNKLLSRMLVKRDELKGDEAPVTPPSEENPYEKKSAEESPKAEPQKKKGLLSLFGKKKSPAPEKNAEESAEPVSENADAVLVSEEISGDSPEEISEKKPAKKKKVKPPKVKSSKPRSRVKTAIAAVFILMFLSIGGGIGYIVFGNTDSFMKKADAAMKSKNYSQAKTYYTILQYSRKNGPLAKKHLASIAKLMPAASSRVGKTPARTTAVRRPPRPSRNTAAQNHDTQEVVSENAAQQNQGSDVKIPDSDKNQSADSITQNPEDDKTPKPDNTGTLTHQPTNTKNAGQETRPVKTTDNGSAPVKEEKPDSKPLVSQEPLKVVENKPPVSQESSKVAENKPSVSPNPPLNAEEKPSVPKKEGSIASKPSVIPEKTAEENEPPKTVPLPVQTASVKHPDERSLKSESEFKEITDVPEYRPEARSSFGLNPDDYNFFSQFQDVKIPEDDFDDISYNDLFKEEYSQVNVTDSTITVSSKYFGYTVELIRGEYAEIRNDRTGEVKEYLLGDVIDRRRIVSIDRTGVMLKRDNRFYKISADKTQLKEKAD